MAEDCRSCGGLASRLEATDRQLAANERPLPEPCPLSHPRSWVSSERHGNEVSKYAGSVRLPKAVSAWTNLRPRPYDHSIRTYS